VRLAHQFAFESDLVTADMVEAVEFPDLAYRYAVRGVPRTVVNEQAAVEGMMPETAYLDAILHGAKQPRNSA
jgi:predicted DsbA family dithiol-disulfide isomerase